MVSLDIIEINVKGCEEGQNVTSLLCNSQQDNLVDG